VKELERVMDTRQEIRETLRLAIPISMAHVALMMMGLVDAALVGHVSDTQLAAVSLGNSLAFAMMCPAMGVTMAVEPLASQAVGAGDEARAWESLRAGMAACLVLAVPTMVVVAASAFVLGPFGVDATVVPDAQRMIWSRLPGIPCWLLFLASKAYLEARGETRPLLLGGWAANVLNFVICALLVYGDRALARVGLPGLGLPQLGSLGAGLATSISNLILAAIALRAVWRIRPAGASLRGVLELGPTARRLIKIGVPIGFQILTEVGVFAVASLLIGRLGPAVTAAHQVALGLASFSFMGVLGMDGATAVRVGRAIGAREHDGPRRAGLVGVGLVLFYMGFWCTLFLTIPGLLARLFTDKPEVIATSIVLLRVAAAFQLADGVQGVVSGALRGAADTRFASWINVVGHWGIGLPLALLLLRLGHGAEGVWWGLCAGLYAVAVVLVLRFLRVSSRAIVAV
jgi:MATE family multidrug resistance protein